MSVSVFRQGPIMADPTKFNPHFNYSGWEAAGNKRPKPGAELDIDFANIARSVDETIDALKDIRRSDGKLNNGVVGPDAFDEAARDLIAGTAAHDAAEKARQAALEAEQARDDAESLYGDLEAVEQAKEEAQTARDDAQGARDAAQWAAGQAQTAQSGADAAKLAAEAARDAAVSMAPGVYPDTSAGLAATTDGDYFSVPSDHSDEYLILYRNDNGSAEEISRYPSSEAVATRAPIERPVFEGGLRTPLANIGDARLTETEVGFAIEDADGNRVLEIGPDGDTRMVQASAEKVSVGQSSLTEGDDWPC